jgi:hypothetical protein
VMKSEEIFVGRVYRGTDGRTRRVLSITGRTLRYRDANPKPRETKVNDFAAWAVSDVTPPRTALASTMSQ